MGVEDVTRDELLAEMQAALLVDTPPEGEGWFTLAELAGDVMTRTAARWQADKFVRAGKWETKKFGNWKYYRKRR